MNLFLTSYFAGTEKQFVDFVEEKKVGKEVLFIQVAAEVESYTKYVDDAKEVFDRLGYHIHILDFKNQSQSQLIKAIQEAKVIYVSGGNTFYLLQTLQEYNLLEVLCQVISKGTLYIGESAGAIITSKDISYIQAADDEEQAKHLRDYKGLGLVEFSILPHYGEEPFIQAMNEIYETYHNQLDLLVINNHQAVLVEDGRYQVI